MSSTQASIEIEAPIKTIYEVITDFEAYPEFLSETKKVEVQNITAKSARVKFTVSIIKKINYVLDFKFSPNKGISWTLVEGDLMKTNSGHWKLKDKKGVVEAEYGISVDFGGLVPKTISNKLVGSNLPSMLKAFKARAEELA
ncbi:MAG: SRPBCC family protein [Deltaproteobacteria bacterium]|nr:SRPBCC family protein [Deltaproteobacteria bacterium]